MDFMHKRDLIALLFFVVISLFVLGCNLKNDVGSNQEATEYFEEQINQLKLLINERRLVEFNNLATLLLEEAEIQNNKVALAGIMTQQVYARLLSRDLDGIKELGQKSIEIADLSGDIKQRVETRKWYAEIQAYFNEHLEGIETLDEVLVILQGTDHFEYKSLIRATRAKLLRNLDRNYESLEEYLSVLPFYEQKNDLDNLAVLYNSIGLIYNDKGDFDLSLEYYLKANKAARANNSIVNLSFILNNISLALNGMEEFTRALDTLQVAVQFNTTHNNQFGVIQNYFNMSNNFLSLGEYESARDIATEGLRRSEALQFPHGVMFHSSSLASAHNQLGNVDRAYFYANQAIEFADRIQLTDIVPNMTLLLSNIYRDRGNYEKAYLMFKRSTEVTRELDAARRSIELSELSVKYRLEQKEAQFVLLEQNFEIQKRLNRYQQLGLILLVFVSFIIAGFLVKNYRNQKRLRVLLNEVEEQRNNISDQNKELNRLNDDRETLIGIIVHDLKNPLFSISGLIELIQMKKHDIETTQYLSLIVQSTVKMSALINSLLDVKRIEKSIQSSDIETIHISPLIEEMLAGFHIQARRKQIEIVSEIQNLTVLTQPDYIVRICENLISNSIKFSYPQTKIRFIIKLLDELRWTIIVEDEGPGIPEKERSKLFKMFSNISVKPTGGEDSTGVGLYTVLLLVQRLKGVLYLDTNYKKGARFVCEFPIQFRD